MRGRDEAKQWVIDGMTSCTPKGCPLSFTEVLSAKFVKKNVVVAEVKMFDGLPGTIEVSQHSFSAFPIWGICWMNLPGGALELVGTEWKRVVEPPPTQMVLDLAM